LGALPGFNSSFAFWVSNSGHVVGVSENGIDPLTGFRALEAVLWGKDGSITDLGTLGGNQSNAFAVNNLGQVAGAALNTIPDLYTPNFILGSSATTQAHAFRWTKSQGMQDLGTLGGADSAAFYINDSGQIAGFSFTDSTVNPTTGLPTLHPFLWENGKMTDLGTLGGTFAGPFTIESFGGLNNRGEVVGTSNLAGDVIAHPFLWTKSEGMKDLGTLGGTLAFATWINDAGEVVGLSGTLDDQFAHAFLWRDGVMTDLGTPGTDPDSQARSINSRGQVVGGTFGPSGDLHGFLWENGSIVDVNTLIAPGSGATITDAADINDRGEIAALGFLSNGDARAFLLIPCDEDHRDIEGCDYDSVEAVTEAPIRLPQLTAPSAASSFSNLSPAERVTRFRSVMANRNRRFGAVAPK
jgi:probable HAF family extracellular repeat protein